jgi:hypothetical protein
MRTRDQERVRTLSHFIAKGNAQVRSLNFAIESLNEKFLPIPEGYEPVDSYEFTKKGSGDLLFKASILPMTPFKKW